jgi:CheY-like chemotaxis protein
MRIILIDDDPDDALIFGDVLREINPSAQFEHFIDSAESLKILLAPGADLPDMIFLDISMPIVNGWHCLTEFKKAAHLKQIPVFMYSTSSRNREIEMAHELGAAGFLTKPDGYELLKDLLTGIVNNKTA